MKQINNLRAQQTVKVDQKYMDIDAECESRLTEQLGQQPQFDIDLAQYEDDIFAELLAD